MPRVLIVEDQVRLRKSVAEYLVLRGCDVVEAESCREAEEAFRSQMPDVALIDYRLPDGDALELLPRLKGINPEVPVVILTGHGSVELAVRAMKEGAEQFLTKPVDLGALHLVITRLLETGRLKNREAAVRSKTRRKSRDPFHGRSEVIRRLAEDAHRVAESGVTVMLQGETGSGKGVLARWLHDHGPRAEEVFVDLNCAGFTREFLDSELFGFERGAFTGAVQSKAGLLEIAHRGTAFLDEIGDMEPALQPKLLKVLEEKRIRRLGALRDRQIDVRLITATHQNMDALLDDGRFRRDLFYRLNTIVLTVPPLRQRREDIPDLAVEILASLAADVGRPAPALTPRASRLLAEHSWPGNVRELRNILERALLLSRDHTIDASELQLGPAARRESSGGFSLTMSLEEVERRHIELVLADQQGHVERAAAILGVSRSSLYEKVRRHGIVIPRVERRRSAN